MGVSGVMPVLPQIAKEMNAPIESIGLILTCFTLPGIFLTPLAGIAADRYGRKTVLLPSLIVFGIAGTACAFTHDLNTLITLRFIQGLGAAPLGVLYTTIIGDLYSGTERTRVMGYNSAVLSLGTAIFPAIGGLLGELGWNWAFVQPLVALPLCYCAWKHLDTPKPAKSKDLKKYFRTALVTIRSRQAVSLFSITLLSFCIIYGPLVTFFPILSDTRFQMSPASIGGIFAISSFATAIAASQMGKLTRWITERYTLVIAGLLYAIGMTTIPLASSFWCLLIPISIFGLAQGFNFPNITTLLTSLAPLEQRAAIMAVNGTILRLAQTVAPMLFTLLYWIGGINGVYYGGAICGIGILLIAALRVTNEKPY